MRVTISFVILLVLAALPVCALDMDGLVLYLPFDEGAGAVAADASGTGNDGAIEGNVTWVDGQFGGAIQISDDAAGNRVVVADDDTLDMTDAMTVAAWINLQSVPDGSNSFLTKADTYMVHISDWSGNGIEQELLLWPFDAWQTAASTPIQLNEWRFVVGTFDGANIAMYIDGELMGERPYGDLIAVTEAEVVIGRDSRSCCSERLAAMTLDEVMLWNRALAASEVLELMGGATAVQPEGLLTTSWGQLKSGL